MDLETNAKDRLTDKISEMKRKDDHYARGYAACFTGDTNPHPFESQNWLLWRDGYIDASCDNEDAGWPFD